MRILFHGITAKKRAMLIPEVLIMERQRHRIIRGRLAPVTGTSRRFYSTGPLSGTERLSDKDKS